MFRYPRDCLLCLCKSPVKILANIPPYRNFSPDIEFCQELHDLGDVLFLQDPVNVVADAFAADFQ